MDPESSQQLLTIIVFLIFSAFFSSAETSLTSLSKLRLRNMIDEGKKGAVKIEKITQEPGKLLSTILVGNNLVNIGASSIATAMAINLVGETNNGIAVTISTVVLTIAILIFGEITPKTFASQHSEKVALFVYKPIEFFIKVLSPVVTILNVITSSLLGIFGITTKGVTPIITEAELKTILNVSQEEGVLEISETEMIHNVFDFGDSKARDIMTPRTDIIALPHDATYTQTLEVFEKERFSRIPVYKDNTDDIIGVLSFKEFIFEATAQNYDITSYAREPHFTYEAKPVTELFSVMKTKSIAMAIVLDEYAGTAGIITLEDLVEEIVGEIMDEDDENESGIELIRDKEYNVDPSTKIEDVNEILNIQLESDDYETIGGYVIGLLNRIPDVAESVEHENIRFTIEEIDKNRIEKLKITILD